MPTFEINREPVTSPPRPSATVLLLRDGPAGLEVLMQRRSDASDVLGGAFVFPGGKVDRADAESDMLARLDRPAEDLHQAVADPSLAVADAAACFVAAARETFEEAGVLLALESDGTWVSTARVEVARDASRGGLGFVEVLEQMDLRIATEALLPWARWITPRTPSLARKRFDSRFFLARAPLGQTVRHDDHEATESVWIAPRTALERGQGGEIMLAPPQLMSLVELARLPDVDTAMQPASRPWPRLVEPHSFDVEGTRAVAYPGDELHPVRERVMPGPTRLIFRDGRFEPFDGFDKLFA